MLCSLSSVCDKSLERATFFVSVGEISFGQEKIIPTIKKLIEKERRQWLFHGPTGIGKTSLARIVARAFRGVHYPEDVLEFNCSSFDGIGDLRETVEKVQMCHS